MDCVNDDVTPCADMLFGLAFERTWQKSSVKGENVHLLKVKSF